MMTEAEAWREVARRFALAIAPYGLCYEIAELCDFEKVSESAYRTMSERVDEHLGGAKWAYEPRAVQGCWDIEHDYSEHREARCLAALWLALEAEEGA
jgi:hypothetical protein